MLNGQKPLATKICMKKKQTLVIGGVKFKNHEDSNGPREKTCKNLYTNND